MRREEPPEDRKLLAVQSWFTRSISSQKASVEATADGNSSSISTSKEGVVESRQGLYHLRTTFYEVLCREPPSSTPLCPTAGPLTARSCMLRSNACGKFGLRALAQSLAREYQPQGIHAAHIIVDGRISRNQDTQEDTTMNPDAIAEVYWQVHKQHRSAWTQELDLRPFSEKF